MPNQYFPVEGAIELVQTGDPGQLVKGRVREKWGKKEKKAKRKIYPHPSEQEV